jgi:hypothetical protein
MKKDEYNHRTGIVEFAKKSGWDGALLAVWRHGLGCTLTRKEQAMYLRNAGLMLCTTRAVSRGDRNSLGREATDRSTRTHGWKALVSKNLRTRRTYLRHILPG